jgi:flagella basal body P-ring formation protein FlgA
VTNTAQSSNDNASKTVVKTPNIPTSETSSVSAVTSSTIIRRGIAIKASDLSVKTFPSHRINEGHFKKPNELIGFEATQTIPKGALISLNMVRQPSIIKKGATVTIIYDQNGIFVSNEGVALKDAGIRQSVDVYIPKTNKTVTGVVDKLGRVKIN